MANPGKLKRFHANHSHILTKKSAKRKRKLRHAALAENGDAKRVKRMLQGN